MDQSRGKSTPGSTAGSFRAVSGARSRVVLADVEGDGVDADVELAVPRPEIADVGEYMNVLPAWEVGKVGVRMQAMSREWAMFLSSPAVMAGLPRVRAKDGTGLWTGQGTVRQATVDGLPDDDRDVRLVADGGDAWSELPVVFKIGRQRVVRDGHHRLMRRLQAGEPIEYILVDAAGMERAAAERLGSASGGA